MFYTVTRKKTPGPTVCFDCPKCGATAVEGTSFELLDTASLMHLIPLLKMRNTYVKCSRCRAQLTSQLAVDELERHADLDLTPYVSYDVSFVFKFLAIAALVLCWAPVMGLTLTVLALAGTYRVAGWPRTLALVSAVPALFATALVLVAAVLGKL